METNTLLIGFNNGKYCPLKELMIPIDNLAIGRSYAAYEFFKIIKGNAFYLNRHLDRFFNSINKLKLHINYTKKEIEYIVNQLIVKNSCSDFQMEVYAIPMNLKNDPFNSNLFILPCIRPAFDIEIYESGANLLMKEYLRFLPEAKSTNYIASVFWEAEIKEMNAVDVLYYHDDVVLECSRGNIFVVKNGKVFTPDEEILRGVTRSIVIDLMSNSGIHYSLQPITKVELLAADEVFISSTNKLIMPIVKINNFEIGKGIPGPITERISELYMKLLE